MLSDLYTVCGPPLGSRAPLPDRVKSFEMATAYQEKNCLCQQNLELFLGDRLLKSKWQYGVLFAKFHHVASNPGAPWWLAFCEMEVQLKLKQALMQKALAPCPSSRSATIL